MSSIGFRQLGKQSTLTSLVRGLIGEYQKFVARSVTIESTDFRAIHRSTQSLLKYNELAIQSKVKPITTQFYAPYEPDYQHVVLMLPLSQMGRYAVDASGFGNRGRYAGAGYAPQKIMDDGIDIGFGENSQYFHFDGKYTFIYVEDTPKLRAQKVNSMSFTFRIYLMPHSWTLSDPLDQSKPRYIFAKSDDNNQQYGYACAMYSDGSLKFTWSKAGVRTTVVTPQGTIATAHAGYTDTGYTATGYNVEPVSEEVTPEEEMMGDMAFSTIAMFQVAILCNVQEGFDPNGYDLNGFITGSGNDIQIAVDSQFLTPDEPHAVVTYYNQQSTDHLDLFTGNQEDIPDDIDDPLASLKIPNYHENFRLRIGAAYPFSGEEQSWFKWIGGIQDFRIYRDMQLSEGQLQALFDNKLSIAEYPFGQIALAGYTLLLPTAVGCCGYDADGFDGSGYDTGYHGKDVVVQLTEHVKVGQ